MPPFARSPTPRVRFRWLVFAFIVGLAVTMLEFGAVRLFAPFFGQSPLVWANVIGVVLLALALGSALGGRLAERMAPELALRRIAACAGILVTATPFLGPRIARLLLPSGFATGPALDLAVLASLAATILVFGLPLTCLGAISPLTLRAIGGNAPIGRSGGLAMMASTLGAVAGGYVTTLVLIPAIGSRRTLLLCGLMLLLCSLLALASRPVRTVLAGCALAGLAGMPEFALPAKGVGLAGDRVLLEAESAMQTIRVLERDETVPGGPPAVARARILALDEGDAEYHSVKLADRVDTLGRYYDLFPILPELLAEPRSPVRVLVLGFCAGSAWRALEHVLGDRLAMTGIEIDPGVLDAAHRYFAVPRDDPRLRLLVADARVYVATLTPHERFDLVIVDSYAQQQYIPFHVATREFFAQVRAHLTDDGILCANLDARRATAALPRAIAATVAAAGYARIAILPVPDFPSALLIARPVGTQPFLPARLPPPPFAALLARCWPKLLSYPPNATSIVLTDDHAPIERIIDTTLLTGEVDG